MSYTFNSKWIQPFESTWCTNEKFKFANVINGIEYESILGISSSNDNFSNNSDSLLSDIDVINRLEKITSSSFNNCHMRWIKMILGPLYFSTTFDRYFATYLRYCPQCLSHGYHTVYTQLIWETHCPFHGTLLEDRVPSNRAIDCRILTGIHHRKKHSGFELKYGESPIVLNTGQIFSHWQTLLDTSFITNNLPTCGDYQYALYYMPFSLNDYDYTLQYFELKATGIKKILSLKLTQFIQRSSIISTRNLLISFNGPINTENIQNYLIKVYLAIYKSIAKYFRKQEKKILIALHALHADKPMKYRESLVELVKKGILNKSVYAYILWSRDILGYSNYMRLKPQTLFNTTTIPESPFFKYLLYEVKQYFIYDYNMPIDTLLAILQYIIVKLFWAQYKTYYNLADSELDIENRKFIHFNQKVLADMPLLISYFDKDSGNCYILDSDYV